MSYVAAEIRLMLMTCVVLIVTGSWAADQAARHSSALLEVAAGLLIVGGLILLGYELHKIIAV